jgi:tRNA nucleotidyltransferase (CCA-adding enzyme)
MKKLTRYRVGGCVRDFLLGRPNKDVDWVVVGASEKEMLARGFSRVGQDFPVFLHPTTKEEHALARTERKSAPGYKGFRVDASPEITLEQDLIRRDLTINAMAQTPDGDIVDPFGGQADLEARVLRHVGEAFVEDPLRVLRAARFASQLGFQLAPETRALMTEIASSGELAHLTPERVWMETEKALASERPAEFFRILESCQALPVVFPELAALVGVEQPPEHHPEGCAWTHVLLVLEQAARLTPDPLVRYAALVHDLGKGLTPPEEWPRHHGHEKSGAKLVTLFSRRIKAPARWERFGALVAEHHMHFHRLLEMRAGKIVNLLQRLDVRHGFDTLERFVLACEADQRGRKGLEDRAIPHTGFLLAAAVAARGIPPRVHLKGRAVGERLHQEQCEAVKQVRRSYPR